MSSSKGHQSGLRGASLIAITYIYFLIFAQFAFLRRLARLEITDAHLKGVMAAMAIGGILCSLLTPRLRLWTSPNLRLRAGLAAAGAAALLSLLPLNLAGNIAVSLLIGAGLGILTVTLVTHLRQWTGSHNPLMMVGLGTGTGYLICNLPGFFDASAEFQASVAALLCFAGIALSLWSSSPVAEVNEISYRKTHSFVRVIACFAALVWLDSAAFFIIQNSASLKAGTWQGPTHLWANGVLHLAAALASASLLQRRSLWLVVSISFLTLASACLLLLNPHRIVLASVFYPVGVSLYSVALVAYPSLLSPASSAFDRGKQAGWIYAIAGWAASAMGIGMAQNLGRVPPGFVFVAGIIILVPGLFKALRWRVRELALTGIVAFAAFCIYKVIPANPPSAKLSQVARGRQVYISEGCISCHSQYVRPNTADVLMWGPTETMQQLRQQKPPLIGNRRQGPDLSEVGGRRSPMWLKAHFFNPAEVSGASIMPSFGFLFRDQRGDDLVAYLESLQTSALPLHLLDEENWHPSPDAVSSANDRDGGILFHRYCATCHDAGGETRWAGGFKKLPPDLVVGPFSHLPYSSDASLRRDRLAQITKFGLSGTDMPGHEYLPDNDVASISLWVSENIRQPIQNH